MDVNPHVSDALVQMRLGTRWLNLQSKNVGDAGAATLAAELRVNTTLETLDLDNNEIGHAGARSLASALTANVTLKMLSLDYNNIRDDGARAFAMAFRVNAARDNPTLTLLSLESNNIGEWGVLELAGVLNSTSLSVLNLSSNRFGVVSARALAAALHTNVRLSRLRLVNIDLGDEVPLMLARTLQINTTLTRLVVTVNATNGAQALASALDTNRTLQSLWMGGDGNGVTVDIKNRVADRLRVNKIVPTVPAWVASAAAKVAEVPFYRDLPPGFAARAAVLAFGCELLEQVLPCGSTRWRTPEGREFATAYLLSLVEASLLHEQRR
jgi:hypothetical protein